MSTIRAVLRELCWLLVLAVVVYAPVLMDLGLDFTDDYKVRILFAQALGLRSVQFDLLVNLFGHLLPLLLVHASIGWLSHRAARLHRLNAGVVRGMLLCCAWILMAVLNRKLFPDSGYAIGFDALAGPALPTLAALILGAALVRAAAPLMRWRPIAQVASLAVGASLLAMASHPFEGTAPAASLAPRQVFVLGVDSLSQGLLDGVGDELPNLHALMKTGIRYDRAYTPLGRTFPSWMSLLSGRSPVEHGALFNLRRIDRVERSDLITHRLRMAGYRTVFAMDERRFSNIDESFGFDEVVGPKAGVLDFVLQRINDTPLTNLLLQTDLSQYLFPYSRSNVASHVNYDANGFVDSLIASVRGADRVFVAAHFESAHYPYRTRHALSAPEDQNPFRRRHVQALGVVDAQIGRLLEKLARLGYLEDALVVLVSDHGEGFGETESTAREHGAASGVFGYGHGADVLSEAQNRIVLGLVPFRHGTAVRIGKSSTELVSIADLRAAIESYVSAGRIEVVPRDECLFVETGLRLWAASDYRTLNEAAVASEGAGFYEISPSGRLQLREERLPELVASKDVGWRCADRITYFSSARGQFFSYTLGPDGVLAERTPDSQDIERIRRHQDRLVRAVRSEASAAVEGAR